MNNMPDHVPLTLEDIERRKAEVFQQLNFQKKAINELGRQLLAPLQSAANKTNVMVRAFNTGMAVFDGVVLGIKLTRNFRNLFKRGR